MLAAVDMGASWRRGELWSYFLPVWCFFSPKISNFWSHFWVPFLVPEIGPHFLVLIVFLLYGGHAGPKMGPKKVPIFGPRFATFFVFFSCFFSARVPFHAGLKRASCNRLCRIELGDGWSSFCQKHSHCLNDVELHLVQRLAGLQILPPFGENKRLETASTNSSNRQASSS